MAYALLWGMIAGLLVGAVIEIAVFIIALFLQ
jgi:hypothetical protein